MKDKSIKQILFALVCVAGYTVLIHAFSDTSWWVAFIIAGSIQTVMSMQSDIRTLRGELNHVATCFSIADAELVRVSALASELQDEGSDLRQKLAELESSILFHKH